MIPQKVESVYQLLRATLGVMALAAGLDKFVGLLANWSMYLAPPVRDLLPEGGGWFMYVVGVIEVVVGIAVLSGGTRVFGYLLCAWLIGIACNLVVGGWYDIAVRDLALAAAAFSLARLSEARAEPAEVLEAPVATPATTVTTPRVSAPRELARR